MRPTWLTVPAARSSAGSEAVELAASAGLVLDGWQAAVLEGALGERDDGRWAARSVAVIVPRQNGKGALLEARELAGLFLFGERLLIHSAHEFKTAVEAFRRIVQLVESSDDLVRQVARVTRSHGDEGIELRNGSRLRFMARSKGAGRGFSADTVIVDEAYDFLDHELDAIMPTMSARPNPQLWFTSSAPLEDERSYVLRRFMRQGRQSDNPTLAYFEWCAGDDDDSEAEATWGRANPGYPHRITHEDVADELGLQDADGFRRERLGIVDLNERVTLGMIDVVAWEALRDSRSVAEDPVAFALDVSPDRRWSSFVVAGHRADGRTHVEIVDRRQHTGWVIERAVELHARWGVPLAISSGSPASSLIPELTERGVPIVEVSNAANARACGILLDLVNEGRIVHRGDLALRDAVANAYPRDYGDLWLWSRKRAAGQDISPLVAATIAIWVLNLPKPEEAPPVRLVTL